MPGMSLDDAARQAYEFVDVEVTLFDTLDIRNPLFDEPILVVNSFEILETGQGTFYPVQFGIKLPETEGAVRGEMVISVEYITVEARQSIRYAVGDPNATTIKYRQYIGGRLENPSAELPTILQVSSVTETADGIEARALLPDLVGQFFPRRLMTVDSLPGCRI